MYRLKEIEKYTEDLYNHIHKMTQHDIEKLNPSEVEYMVALCDLHEGLCAVVDEREKLDGKHYDGSLFDNPRRR